MCHSCAQESPQIIDDRFHIKVVDLENETLQFYWKNDDDAVIGTFNQLQEHVKENGHQLTYAMNGGMYLKDQSPQGLYIENGIILKQIDTVQQAFGNFYLQPNGVFGITKDSKAVVKTSTDVSISNLQFATQSGPMLVIEGELHPALNKGSKNIHLRNAVGILPDGNVLLVLSKEKINFYDLATFFKDQGCKNALYLDGFVPRIYDSEQGVEQMDGNFGVILGITK